MDSNTKLETLNQKLSSLQKKRQRTQTRLDELDREIWATTDRKRIEELRQHIGGTVEIQSGDIRDLGEWMQRCATLESVGRTKAKIDFGDKPGRYTGRWTWPAADLVPVTEDASK